MTLGLHVKGNKMNVRLVALIATVTIVTTSGGCSGMRNFLFGRGAACGVCPSQGPNMGLPGPELGCGMEPGCGYEPGCGHEPVRRRGCGLFGGGVCNGSDSCSCSGSHGFAPNPYGAYSGGVNDPYAMEGEVIGSEMIGGPYNGYPGTIVGDNFGTRGGQIMSVEPAPRTSTPAN
jgi:hypothetical protein